MTSVLAAVLLLLTFSSAQAAFARGASGPGITIGIDTPAPNSNLAPGQVSIQGHISGGRSNEVTSVVFAVDVSGSTASPNGDDCNGDKKSDKNDDFNTDGNIGDTLDCEISAVDAVDGSLRGVPNSSSRIAVGLVPFGSSAATATVDPTETSYFVAPGATGGGRSTTPDLLFAAGSLRQGSIDEYDHFDVGEGTNFNAAVQQALMTLHEAKPGPKWIFFLSDGQSTVSQTTLDSLAASGVHLRSFAVGVGASCNGTALAELAAAGGETCITATDPSTLAGDVLSAKPSDIDHISVAVAGKTLRATIDSVGNWTATTTLNKGSYTARATAYLANGATASSSAVPFRVAADYTYVALGDSYSAGEGVRPFLGEDASGTVSRYDANFLCHRSTKGYPELVTLPGQKTAIAQDPHDSFSFAACSGARIVNLDTTQQEKPEPQKKTYKVPLQYNALSANTRLVTLTIGGNDVAFAEVIKHCLTTAHCQNFGFVTLHAGTPQARDVTLAQWAESRLALLQGEEKAVYANIKARTLGKATVVALTYPQLLKTGSALTCTESKALGSSERQFIASAVNQLDDSIVAGAKAEGILSGDVRNAFAGHAICDHDDWINGVTNRVTYYDVGTAPVGDGSFHPNARGQQAYATTVNTVLAKNRITAKTAAEHHAVRPAVVVGRPIESNHHRASRTPAQHVSADRRANRVAHVKPVSKPSTPSPRPSPSASLSPSASASPTTSPHMAAFVSKAADLRPTADAPLSAADLAELAKVTIADVSLGDLAARHGKTSCPTRVSAREVVPVTGSGFGAGSSVEVSLSSDSGKKRVGGVLTADQRGVVLGSIAVPASFAPVSSSRVLRIQLAGVNADRAPAIGSAVAYAGGSAQCAADAKAGHAVLGDAPGAPRPVLLEQRVAPVPSSTSVAVGRVANTGSPLVSDGTFGGTILLVAGTVLVFAGRRRRRTDRSKHRA